MTWGQIVDTAAVESGLEYAKRRLSQMLSDRPVEEIELAREAYKRLFEAENNDNALGIEVYLTEMIRQRRATV